jgi:hypothetical protein
MHLVLLAHVTDEGIPATPGLARFVVLTCRIGLRIVDNFVE